MSDDTPRPLNNVITIDDERIKSHLDRVVRGTVEETLNALLDAEANRLCNAQLYERCLARRDTRAGQYDRGLQTKAGEVRLRVPKPRQQTFETAIIERYRSLRSFSKSAYGGAILRHGAAHRLRMGNADRTGLRKPKRRRDPTISCISCSTHHNMICSSRHCGECGP